MKVLFSGDFSNLNKDFWTLLCHTVEADAWWLLAASLSGWSPFSYGKFSVCCKNKQVIFLWSLPQIWLTQNPIQIYSWIFTLCFNLICFYNLEKSDISRAVAKLNSTTGNIYYCFMLLEIELLVLVLHSLLTLSAI